MNMRIAIVHSFYSSASPSGENSMVLEQVAALRGAGHEVALISQHTDDVQNQPLYEARSALRVVTGLGTNPLKEIAEFSPEVIHVHNLFPNYGSTWLKQVEAPIVSTMHNFRPLCANGLLFRDGHSCFNCPDGDSAAAVRHACYHDSRVASVPLAIRNSRGVQRNELIQNAAAVICLSTSSALIFEKYGVDKTKLHVIPNGIDAPDVVRDSKSNGRWIAIGRLAPEKGFAGLISDWPQGQELDIVGDGAGDDIPADLPAGVKLLGPIPRDKLVSDLPSYNGLVFPSICLEMQPTVVLEAMAAGIPVAARAGNAGADLVNESGGGVTYGSALGLSAALARAADNRRTFGGLGRRAFDQQFCTEKWMERLSQLYEEVVYATKE